MQVGRIIPGSGKGPEYKFYHLAWSRNASPALAERHSILAIVLPDDISCCARRHCSCRCGRPCDTAGNAQSLTHGRAVSRTGTCRCDRGPGPGGEACRLAGSRATRVYGRTRSWGRVRCTRRAPGRRGALAPSRRTNRGHPAAPHGRPRQTRVPRAPAPPRPGGRR